jgi:putative ABC transport system ATP-binding protein
MTVNTPTALAFRNVSKVYESAGSGSRYALREVSFDVPAGRRIAVVGRSGSGKSTLLHLAAGIDVPTTGEVMVFGKRLSTLSEAHRTLLRRDQIGLIFQFFHLMQHLSVRDNVALPAMIAGDKPTNFEPRVAHLLHCVGLGDRADDRVQKLSGGEMQRVAICRALMRRPQLLLADEAEGSTLIYVTHSRDFASLADEVWHLHSGVLETQSV